MAYRKIINDSNSQLLGDNFSNDTSSSYKSLSSFKIDTNFTGKITKDYENILTSFSKPISLEDLSLSVEDSKLIERDNNVILNIDNSDLKSYIRYGSTLELIKATLNNIIINYPASLYIDSKNYIVNPVNTIFDYIYDVNTNKSSFKITSENIVNKFGLIYDKDNYNIPDNKELRNLNISYNKYCVYVKNKIYEIDGFTGNTSNGNYVSIELNGIPFENDEPTQSQTFHIKPKPIVFNKFKKTLNDLENYFLSNRLDDNNGFQFFLKNPSVNDNGTIAYSDKKLIWPTSDGYNIDYEGGEYNRFIELLKNISYNYDQSKTDIINRYLKPPSLEVYDQTQDKKISKLLKVWGRNFDEIKKFIDALTRINKLSYDKKNNVPDVLVKNLARTFGWDDLKLLNDDKIINNFFSTEYEENKNDLLPSEIDLELWRRILINTNYFWKTKGTRNSILSMFKLIGIPEPFINLTEHIYTVDDKINISDVELSLEDLPSKSLPYNDKGYPIAPIETNDFFFQISGNTDSGQHYINNFRNVGFQLNRTVDNKKSWVYSGATEREDDTTIKYYQESSDLIINTKEIDLSIDASRAIEYDVFDYIKNKDYPNNSNEYAKPYTFINLDTEFNNGDNVLELPDIPVGDVQVNLNGISLTNGYSGNTTSDFLYPEIFGTGFNNKVEVLVEDDNGKHIIGGEFTEFNGSSINRLIRLNQDGSIDNTFNIGTGFNDTILSIIQDNTGKYVLGGSFTEYNETSTSRIIRLNQDGSIDNTFNIGTGFNINVRIIYQDNTGKYIVGGNFTSYNGNTSNRIIRLNQDGSIDNTFNIGTGFNSSVHSIIQDSNGKYLVGGNFTSYNGNTSNRIIRLNQDGSIDNTFNIGIGFNSSVYSIIQDSNGKYLVGGNFTSYNENLRNKIIRLNQDGSIDNTFNIGSGFYKWYVYSIIEDSNGKYVIGGNFSEYNGNSANNIIRLNQDGSIDSAFNVGYGFNNAIYVIIQDTQNNYLIGGFFDEYNNNNISRFFVKLINLSSEPININNYDYYIDESNTKLIHLNSNLIKNDNHEDIVVITYLSKTNGEIVENEIQYIVTKVQNNQDGTKIALPDKPNGDVQLTLNGMTLAYSSDGFVGDYKLNPVNSKEIIIINNDVSDYLQTNNILQVSYLKTNTDYGLNQKIIFHKINSFSTTKFYYDSSINKYVYKLPHKINNIENIKITVNGITITPNREYVLNVVNKYEIFLPTDLILGDVLGFFYVVEGTSQEMTVPDEFGVGDISELSFLEFIDLLKTKLINAKNRKIITDNNGGFYPTLLRVYINYLKRGELPNDDILKSNAYTYDDLFNFLNKYNSFFSSFVRQLVPATVIFSGGGSTGGFEVRNTIFTRQKFTYKRGVNLNSILNWTGNDGSTFKTLQEYNEIEKIRITIDTSNTYWYEYGSCINAEYTIKSENGEMINNVTVNGRIFFDDDSEESFSHTINNSVFSFENQYTDKKPINIIIDSINTIDGEENKYEFDYELITINHNTNYDYSVESILIEPTNIQLELIDNDGTNDVYNLNFDINNWDESLIVGFDLYHNSGVFNTYNIPTDFIQNGNTFTKEILADTSLNFSSGYTTNFNITQNIVSCVNSYVTNNEEEYNVIYTDNLLKPFSYTVNTDQHTLPLSNGYDYDFEVDWGDGTISTITSWDDANKSHTYSSQGDHQIKITGLCEYVYFYNDAPQLISIDSWGNTGFKCPNLTTIDVSNWNVSNVTNMMGVFNACESLTTIDVSNWNVSNVTDMTGMFLNCLSLTTIDVSNWNISNVTDMDGIFNGIPLDTSSYDALLIGWSSLTPNLQNNVNFGANLAKYTPGGAAEAGRVLLTNAVVDGGHNWTINDGGSV